MEGNDIGSFWSQRIIVVAEPTIFIPPPERSRTFFHHARRVGKKAARAKAVADTYQMNRGMVQFIAATRRWHNMPTEIWTFLDPAVADILAAKLEKVAGDAITGWECWDEPADAVVALRSDNGIHTVYDANSDRVDLYWQMRGHRVAFGGTPR